MNAVSGCIEHTLLKPDATETQIRQLCDEAVRFRFPSVCVNPIWVQTCSRLLEESAVVVCSVVAFPLGATVSSIKVAEARRGIQDGALEIDMVINVGWLKSGWHDRVFCELLAASKAVHDCGARLKVILETPLLNAVEKMDACRLALEAQADYVKTSTGFGSGGATVEDVALLRRVAGDVMGVKAAGGIRDLAAARRMIAAGATRIGTSSGVRIALEEQEERSEFGRRQME